jgi:hypothetical protein
MLTAERVLLGTDFFDGHSGAPDCVLSATCVRQKKVILGSALAFAEPSPITPNLLWHDSPPASAKRDFSIG